MQNAIIGLFESRILHLQFTDLCRVYTSIFDNQVPNGKLAKKVFSCCQARTIFCLYVKRLESLIILHARNLSFKT